MQNDRPDKTPLAPKFSDIKFIDYDNAKYERSEMRMQLTARWSGMTSAAAQ